jgi:mannosyltransferase OCH1-like enzyme|tara:strand:+ start:3114 stop:5411 length:2298 start_codon:yes stop_codon:yes gene_type:complete
MIPKIIHQTFETELTPPGMSKAIDSWKINNPLYVYKFYNAVDRINFLKKNFQSNVLKAYDTLIPGAFKADLFRYCVLYVEGGVYVDADTICLEPLENIINNSDSLLVVRDDPMAKKWLANAMIAVTPKHSLMWEAINKAVSNVESREERFYLDYTGPGLLGKCLNVISQRDQETEYELGDQRIGNQKVKILQHDFTTTQFKYNGLPVLYVEYPAYREEMKSLNNKPFYHYIQTNNVFKKIPNEIIFTTYDSLDINEYMIKSFEDLNPEYEVKYFNQTKVDEWFESSIYKDGYQSLSERGERSDFFRYCYIWENGGVYVDADIFCNQPLRNWIKDQDLIVGLEADMPTSDDYFKGIGVQVDDKIKSVCNWAFAAAPKQMPLNFIINDIIQNPVKGVLQNTGPGRFTKHIISYFGNKTKINNSYLLPINAFGSNQSHSNAFKSDKPFEVKREDVYLTHMFAGTWRGNKERKSIILLDKEERPAVSHNLTLHSTDNGYVGVARYDIDTSRTTFMKELGESKTLVEYKFDSKFKIKQKSIRSINNVVEFYKFEDYRAFMHQDSLYYCVAYLDNNFNTYMGVLDKDYNFLGRINIDRNHKMSFTNNQEVFWEKNWLFFEKENELYFIYSTTPDLIIYKCEDFKALRFTESVNKINHLSSVLPQDQLYFSSNTSTGGSTNPIYIKDFDCYVYLIHTKIYQHRKYNHYAVGINSNFDIVFLNPIPFISSYVGYSLMFITTMIETENHYVISGGIEDNQNFIWEIPKAHLKSH